MYCDLIQVYNASNPRFDFFFLCNLYLSQGKYEDSVKECTKALELNPTYMKSLLRKAEAHEKLENYDEAITGKFCHIVKICTSTSYIVCFIYL